ncbi:MAG: cytidine deaminase [Rhodobacteraceae bacterium]|nr:cytidine deaminase [Paracoccaceae bacterium]
MTNELSTETIDRLFAAATKAMHNAYAPYSKFTVGAALLLENGDIIAGCNVENASFGGTICAERTAIGAAVSQGHRDFKAICVTTTADVVVSPCGICRQSLIEFNRKMIVICTTQNGQRQTFKAGELLPHAFTSEDL